MAYRQKEKVSRDFRLNLVLILLLLLLCATGLCGTQDTMDLETVLVELDWLL